MKVKLSKILLALILIVNINLISQQKEVIKKLGQLPNTAKMEEEFMHGDRDLSNRDLLDKLINSNQGKNALETVEVVDYALANQGNGDEIKYTYKYDSGGRIIEELQEISSDGSSWTNYRRNRSTYDSNGNRLTYLIEFWENSSWVNYLRFTSTYDSNGNILSVLWEDWENSSWVKYERYTYTCDSKGNILTDFGERLINSSWVNTYKLNFTYDSNGNKLLELLEYWENSSWVNYWRYTYTYDSNGDVLSFLREDWEDSSWVNSRRYTYTYDSNGNVLSFLWEDWENSSWVNSRRYTYTYDSNGNRLSELLENWEKSNWVNSWRYTYTYDSNGNMIYGKHGNWDGSAWVMSGNIGRFEIESMLSPFNYTFYAYELNIYYKSITHVEENNETANSFSLSQNYPNPFNPTTTIKYSIPSVIARSTHVDQTQSGQGMKQSVAVTLKVYDILGNELATLVNEEQESGYYEVKFNAGNLASGMYIYRINAGSFVSVKKMLMVK